MTKAELIRSVLQNHRDEFHSIISDEILNRGVSKVDLSVQNPLLQSGSREALEHVLSKTRSETKTTILFGGYAEQRNLYTSSAIFNPLDKEPRNIHLGIDIWSENGTAVYSPLGGVIHSFGFNDNPGDYGATIIMEHQLDAQSFYCLYGHLSFSDLGKIREGQYISRGEIIGHLGAEMENGGWPPHLHFQIIIDPSHYRGDYPGVCAASEKETWLANCPDPELLINFSRFEGKA